MGNNSLFNSGDEKPKFKLTIAVIFGILIILFLSSLVQFNKLTNKIKNEDNIKTSQINYTCIKEIILNVNGYNQKIVLQHPCSISITKMNSPTISSINESGLLIECINGCPP